MPSTAPMAAAGSVTVIAHPVRSDVVSRSPTVIGAIVASAITDTLPMIEMGARVVPLPGWRSRITPGR